MYKNFKGILYENDFLELKCDTIFNVKKIKNK